MSKRFAVTMCIHNNVACAWAILAITVHCPYQLYVLMRDFIFFNLYLFVGGGGVFLLGGRSLFQGHLHIHTVAH